MNPTFDLPAFPQHPNARTNGLTKLEYFAARAPKVIPEWFKPEMPERPKPIGYMEHIFGIKSSHPHKDYFIGAKDKGITSYWDYEEDVWVDEDNQAPPEFKQEVLEHYNKLCQYIEDTKAWELKFKTEIHLQWPIFWAKQVLSKLDQQ